ncbi:acyltransferase-domain-containing protein [Phycomyces nitens]|nr:acyltransferase-domain-containing protein [Phycomyces nitens]
MKSVWSPRAIFNVLVINGGLFFHSTCVVLAQLLPTWVSFFSSSYYLRYIGFTMRMWSQGIIGIVQFFAPSPLVITMDDSCSGNAFQRDSQGNVTGLSFPKRIVVTANHQIYADWLYIWCVSYLAGAHGAMKIVLKESLKNLPVYGMGMQYFDFIFLKRKLADDKDTIQDNLMRSKEVNLPMWLLLFPEGTVISKKMRDRSEAYAKKNDLKDNQYTLLPRSTGLRLSTEALGDSVEWLYDMTIGYSGVGSNDIPEDVYTIQGIFFFGKYPKKVHVHIRRFAVKTIPKEEEAYAKWVQDRWVEKDALMSHFYTHGIFPSQNSQTAEIPIRLKNPIVELLQVYVCVLPYIPFTIVAWPTIRQYLRKYF